jgi:hypothetical protein
MRSKFNPKEKTLDPVTRLLSKANVNSEDINLAISDWKKKPPDPDFENFLEPEIDEQL